MSRPISLADLRNRHDSATGPHAYKVRALARNQARAFCRRTGLPEPKWAARLMPAARKAAQRQAGHAWNRVAPAERPRGRAVPAPVSVDALAALRAWRLAGPGRVVHVHRRGVALHEIGRVRRFASVDAALAAVA